MTIGDEFAAHKLGESATDRARGYVLKAGQDLYAKQDEITSGMAVVLAAEIELIGGDQPLIEQLKRSIRSNVTTLFHGLANEIPIEKIEAPGGAVDYARSLAQRSIPASHLIRAYAIGQNYLLESAFDEVRRGDVPADLEYEVLRRINAYLFRYIDWVSLQVGRIHAEEQNRWSQLSSGLPLIRALLTDEGTDQRKFERGTGYRLTANHLAMILWVRPTVVDAPTPDDTRNFIRTLESACGAVGRPLVQMIDKSTTWIWMPVAAGSTARGTLDLRARVDKAGLYRLAVGVPARDADGFVKSHRLAAKAQSVAMAAASEAERMITCYDDQGVRVASLVVGQLELTRAWVGEVLGQLAKDDDAAAVLRETCRIFLQTGDNYVRTAELLNVHRNTVKYRLGKIPSHVGHGIKTDRITVAVALELCHLLGSRVLEPS